MADTLKSLLNTLLSDVHRKHLKPIGFKKNERTFSRDKGSYWERFHFQASRRNYPGVEDWRFYINVGVEFKDLEPRRWWSYVAHTHWAARLGTVVPGAPSHWTYNLSTDREAFSHEIATLVTEASVSVATSLDRVRQECLSEAAQ